jgi:hypothetical protein
MRAYLKSVLASVDREAWQRFFMAVAGLGLAFTAAVFSSVARERGNMLATAIFATSALLLAGIVGLLTVPFLARRVAAARMKDAFDYQDKAIYRALAGGRKPRRRVEVAGDVLVCAQPMQPCRGEDRRARAIDVAGRRRPVADGDAHGAPPAPRARSRAHWSRSGPRLRIAQETCGGIGRELLSASCLPSNGSGREPMSVLVAPLVEETVFRGFLYPVIARRLGIAAGIAITGTLFGLMHAGNPNSTILGQFPTETGGEHFGMVFAKDNSLAGCVNQPSLSHNRRQPAQHVARGHEADVDGEEVERPLGQHRFP